jgi:regulatory LuxR family protein
VRLHFAGGRSFETARTELAYGEFLRRARQRREARQHLRVALDVFEDVGADRWAEPARAELRASGESARRREPSTIDDLTRQELQSARFVAERLTNRQVAEHLILSPRTVDFHLRTSSANSASPRATNSAASHPPRTLSSLSQCPSRCPRRAEPRPADNGTWRRPLPSDDRRRIRGDACRYRTRRRAGVQVDSAGLRRFQRCTVSKRSAGVLFSDVVLYLLAGVLAGG